MIGTAAIVAMISLSLGLKENAVKSLESWGNLTEMEVAPAYMMPDDRTPIPRDKRKKLDANAVAELKRIPGITAVMPIKELHSEARIKVGRREGFLQLIGVDVHESALYKKGDIEKGTYLTGPNNEIVVSYELPRQLRDVEKEKREARKRNGSKGGGSSRFPSPDMGGESPQPTIDLVGKTATIVLTREYMDDGEPKIEKKEVRVRVVGQQMKLESDQFGGPAAYAPLGLIKELDDWLTRGRGDEDFGDSEKQVRRERGKNEDNIKFNRITVKVASREVVESTMKKIREAGFEVYSPARALEQINSFFFVVQLILGGIAAVSLLVASIGIVNTMIMSILERTKEIGIMKVIGATVYNIRWLFLIESGFIGLIGGLTGLGLAYGAVQLINFLGKDSGALDKIGFGGPEGGVTQIAVVPVWLALFAIGFAFLIGILAGIFPAFRASRLSPLQAIRSE